MFVVKMQVHSLTLVATKSLVFAFESPIAFRVRGVPRLYLLPLLTASRSGGQAGAMSLETAQLKKKLPIVRLAIAGVLVAVVGLLVLREIGMVRLIAWFDLFVTAI